MPRANYYRGRDFEYRVRKFYEKHGWFVVRSAGSKGTADLVAISPAGGEIHFIQCKKRGYIPDHELDTLKEIAQRYNAVPIVATAGKDGRGIRLLIPTNEKPIDITHLVVMYGIPR